MVWWSLAAAFVFMVTLVLAANLFADAVRDAFDPRVRMLRPERICGPSGHEASRVGWMERSAIHRFELRWIPRNSTASIHPTVLGALASWRQKVFEIMNRDLRAEIENLSTWLDTQDAVVRAIEGCRSRSAR